MVAGTDKTEITRLFELLSSVVDPEIPVLTLQDLGVLRDISVEGSEVTVTITPTYAGCPAMETMRADIESALATEGYKQVNVQQKLSPAWTTDWMSQKARSALEDYGIAPPQPAGGPQRCPRCGGDHLEKLSQFGSTPCKAQWRCRDCLEPFEYFKCI